MTEPQSTIITAAEFWQELQSLDTQHLRLVMPVGALVRSVPITSTQGHHPVVELNTAYGEVLTFTVSDNAEIQRTRNVQGERHTTRYDVTFPLGDYFALISG
jgi:hypothetical protein